MKNFDEIVFKKTSEEFQTLLIEFKSNLNKKKYNSCFSLSRIILIHICIELKIYNKENFLDDYNDKKDYLNSIKEIEKYMYKNNYDVKNEENKGIIDKNIKVIRKTHHISNKINHSFLVYIVEKNRLSSNKLLYKGLTINVQDFIETIENYFDFLHYLLNDYISAIYFC